MYLESDIRAPIHPVVQATDASPSGGGGGTVVGPPEDCACDNPIACPIGGGGDQTFAAAATRSPSLSIKNRGPFKQYVHQLI